MADYDPYDDTAARNEARALALQERTDRRLAQLLSRRPPVFATAGELHTDVRAWINRYQAGERGSLLLVGSIGAGKSWSLWKIAETLVRSGWPGSFELAAAYEVKAATDWPVDRTQVRTWAKADLFAIDDLGAQRTNDWDADALAALVDTRWQHQRPTLIASNEPDIKAIVGARAASRLVDGATFVQFTGHDRRRNP